MLLAIDTATRIASIALYDATGVHAETTWRSRENHTVELMAQIVRLLDLAHVQKGDLSAIGVALGPGSFTGLRVGMSVAKGLAFAAHLPLVGIPTLDTVAQPHAFQSMPIWAVLGAGRGRYSVARYLAGNGAVHRSGDYALVNAAGLVELVSHGDDGTVVVPAERVLVCGEIDKALADLLLARLGTRAAIATPAMKVRRAGYLAELAWTRFQRGETDDVQALGPVYAPHESVDRVS